jgi:hypothetical protein
MAKRPFAEASSRASLAISIVNIALARAGERRALPTANQLVDVSAYQIIQERIK